MFSAEASDLVVSTLLEASVRLQFPVVPSSIIVTLLKALSVTASASSMKQFNIVPQAIRVFENALGQKNSDVRVAALDALHGLDASLHPGGKLQ